MTDFRGTLLLPRLPAHPENPDEAQVYYNTIDKVAYLWNGTDWLTLGTL